MLGEVPWNSQGAETIKSHIQKGNGIKILNGKIDEYYKIILDYGLQQDPNNRKLSFLHVRNILEAAPKVNNNCDLLIPSTNQLCPQLSILCVWS